MRNILMTLSLLGLAGLAQAKTVATVNGKAVDDSELQKYVLLMKKVLPPNVSGDDGEIEKLALNQLMTNMVFGELANKKGLASGESFKKRIAEFEEGAKARGLDKDPMYKELLEVTKSNMLTDLYYQSLYDANKPDPAKVKDRYEQYRKRYEGSKTYVVEEIVLDDPKKVSEVYKALGKGESFKSLIPKYTINPLAKTPEGSTRMVNTADMKDGGGDVHKFITSIAKDKYNTKPYKMGKYDHIIHVVDILDAQVPSFEEMRPRFEHAIKKEMTDKEIEKINKDSIVVINPDDPKKSGSGKGK